MEQIYVLEVIVYEIILYEGYKLKNVDNLSLSFKFAQRVNFDIDTQFFSPPKVEETPDGLKILMNFGKTFLFVSKPSVLRQLLQSDPYTITLYDTNTTVGLKQILWKKAFSEMVKFYETLGIVKSTTCEDWHELRTKDGLPVAKLNLFMRMSCFGSNVQTMFQIKKVGDKHNYVFRQRNESKTFQVEKHEDDRVQPIVAPLYTGITDGKSKSQSQINFRENVSLTELFAGAMEDKISIYHGVEDTVSIYCRPSDNKFFNLLSLLTADVKAHDKGTCVTLQKGTTPRPGRDDRDDDISVIDPHELTADKIQRKLCGNADCPAVKKFKEYGIGPLATGKNLGALYSNDIEPPVTYGLSHTYGTMCEYGPYGVFSRPKQEELPFVPLDDGLPSAPKKACRPKPVKNKKSKNGTWHSSGCPLRLRGGSDLVVGTIQTKDHGENSNNIDNGGLSAPKSPMVECKSVMDQFNSILAEYKKAVGPCGQGSCPYAQTLAEDSCRKACDQGIPGTSLPVKDANKGSTMSCEKDPCEMEGCPYSTGAGMTGGIGPTGGEKKKTRYPAGCGSPKCAYTKYKLGLVDDDAQLELQYLPPALGASCGDPHCQHPFAPPLPPIHWDCPDPLPQGPCKNLNCPFLPAPLKKFKTKSLKTGPCGSPTCPYAIPPPCTAPTCPFAMVPCPMNIGANGKKERKPKEKKRNSKDSPSHGENLCEFPGCPFSSKNQGDYVDNDDDYTRYEGDDCGKPDCPSRNNGNKKRNSKEGNRCSTAASEADEENLCENPDCPFAKKNEGKYIENDVQNLTGEFQDCANPNCPYKKKEKKRSKKNRDKHTCDNPDCPSNKSKKRDKKKRDKREKKNYDDVSMCSNPECNYVKTKEKPEKESSSAGSICSDPDCPYAGLKAMKIKKHGNGTKDEDFTCENKKDEESICSNPECPERLARTKKDPNVCDQPGCPYSQQPLESNVCNDPRCPYVQPLPSCGIPNCPYEPIPLRFSCKNPQCPSKSINFSRSSRRFTDENTKRDRSNEEASCSVPVNMELNFTTVCEETVNCDQEEICENPDCDMKNGETDKDKKALVPSGSKKKLKRRKKGKFVYSMGDNYPGTKMGHRECVVPVFNVPPHMGWLWNIFTPIMSLKPRRGWRPGALNKIIAQRIRAHRQAKGLGMLHVPSFKRDGTQHEDPSDPKVVPRPTLQIQKKEGCYWVTMHPLKDPNSLVENEDPYMECTPMTFKITKNKKLQEDYCACDGEASMEESSSSDSELDIEFTPPAGIIHPERFKKRPNVACCQSQYDPQDIVEEKKEKKKDKKGKGKDKKGGDKKDKKDKKKGKKK